MKNYEESAAFEHSFWLQVLGDHARFIRDSLYPDEREAIHQAKNYAKTFNDYLNMVKSEDASDILRFTRNVKDVVHQFKLFKLSLLERQLQGTIRIHLSPTFINHMVNEIEEYLLVIDYLARGEVPPVFHELHHHMLWLLDASGHAGAINDELDGVEKRLKKKSDEFATHFEQFYLKAVELTGYLRTNLESFPALARFNNDVEVEMQLFMGFLHELEEMELSEEVLSTFSALMADHMAREECYYLYKLAESTQGEYPACDPAKPRIDHPD
ncbi:hypothetical protein GCM10010954_23800 [Halobacillus andaensis]|uniref:DUF2935 domain-containing protein n=1 Tax=Halobacillus andaensis TaxID=1176239 RepID=A0A917EVX9_HALAA|nr:DUF2935 domain-containing protein [Halobacillus andaensis]MBP2006030.1 hypothetical protein [Halobacillus andaensis]GGF24146.1 hypothetical protein GCM10010954_23800 [Halobacillus andaensis]